VFRTEESELFGDNLASTIDA
jgi:hypothetical protein